jgi:hypothetical protein
LDGASAPFFKGNNYGKYSSGRCRV